VLITGGTGAIGGHVARWLAGRGADRLILASRSGPGAPGAASLAADLAAAGTAVSVVATDMTDREALAGLMAWIGPSLGGVMHTAGVIDDGVIDSLDASRLGTVLAAKATAARWLDELTEALDLQTFVLFSSAAATFGGPGQGNYAAANAYLDALAENRRSRGLAGLSVAWGPWAGGGLARTSAAVRDRLARGPLPPMDPQLAVQALGQALAGPDALLTVMDADWSQFHAGPPLLRDLPGLSAAPTGSDGGEGTLASQLAGQPAAEQRRILTDLIRGAAATILGHSSPDAVPAGRAFNDLGFDSLTALELRNHLTAVTGLTLPATLVFDYPTPTVLAQHLKAELALDGPEDGVSMPIFTELDQLESSLSDVATNHEIREDITRRLQGILSRWIEIKSAAESEKAAIEFQSATPDEVFDFLDKELGLS